MPQIRSSIPRTALSLVCSSLALFILSLVDPDPFLSLFLDVFGQTKSLFVGLTLIPLDRNEYAASLIKRSWNITFCCAIFTFNVVVFSVFISSFTLTEAYSWFFLFIFIGIGEVTALAVWFFDLRFLPGILGNFIGPFSDTLFSGEHLAISTERRDLSILITTLTGEIVDTVVARVSLFIGAYAITSRYHLTGLSFFSGRWFFRLLVVLVLLYIIGGEGATSDARISGIAFIGIEVWFFTRFFFSEISRIRF